VLSLFLLWHVVSLYSSSIKPFTEQINNYSRDLLFHYEYTYIDFGPEEMGYFNSRLDYPYNIYTSFFCMDVKSSKWPQPRVVLCDLIVV